MPTPLRIGVIGTGGIAEHSLVPALKTLPQAQLWSVLSRDKNRATAFAKQHAAAAPQPAHDNLDEFLTDPQLQAVIIASPDKLHAEQVIACAKAGKHVLVEKPFVTNIEEGKCAIEACRTNGVKLSVALHMRWHSGMRKLHQLVTQEKILGPIRHIRAQWTWRADDASDWRAGDELGRWWPLAGTGPHCLDTIRWFADFRNNPVVDRSALLSREVWKGPHEETGIILLKFANGITAEAISSVLFAAPSRFEIYGADNYAICEGTMARSGRGTISIGGKPLLFDPVNPYAGEIANFIEAIQLGRNPEVTGEDGLQVVEDLLYAVNS